MTSDTSEPLSRISFGCSNLLGDKTAQEGKALLEAAYDAGIRSFDVARVYNFGDAERLVGEFAASRRNELTLTTKFGLMPNANVAKMGGLVNVVRRVMRSSSFVRKLVRRNVSKITQGGRFDVATAQASLDASLRALQTDHIDVYLLHEAAASDCTDELLSFLRKSREEGKLGKFGVGSGYWQIPEIARLAPDFLEVAQFESSAVHDHRREFEAVRPGATGLVVTHGSFGGTDTVRDAIAAKAPGVSAWSKRVGFDLTVEGAFYASLLRCALRANPGGKVIFRAGSPSRIAANMRSLETGFSDEQLDAVEVLCREVHAESAAN